jgi:hypothetical protein
VAVFCAVTLFIWTNRIWLAWTNDEDTVAEKIVWSLPITAFVVVSAVLLVAMVVGVDRDARWFTTTVKAFAGATVAYWAIRLPIIVANDHDLTPSEEVGFKVVHAVLAVASVVPAIVAWRAVRPGGAASSDPTSRTPTSRTPTPAS